MGAVVFCCRCFLNIQKDLRSDLSEAPLALWHMRDSAYQLLR